jgi:hypothetical protein
MHLVLQALNIVDFVYWDNFPGREPSVFWIRRRHRITTSLYRIRSARYFDRIVGEDPNKECTTRYYQRQVRRQNKESVDLQ